MVIFVPFFGLLTIVLALFLYTDSLVNASPLEEEYLEPWSDTIKGLFSEEDCQKIIAEAERIGFPNNVDSIDKSGKKQHPSWSIDVYHEDPGVMAPSLQKLYEPYLPKLLELVTGYKQTVSQNNTPPTLDWVFVRKYKAQSERRSLKIHQDINLLTLNIQLNQDFEGGGLFYLKPAHSNFDPAAGHNYGSIPDFSDGTTKKYFSYDLLDHMSLQNSSQVVFPHLETGDVFVHNFTTYHAIAPLQTGTRYSLLMFYDMKHPYVDWWYKDDSKLEELDKEHDEEDFDEDEDAIDTGFVNKLGEDVDIYWVDEEDDTREFFETLKSGEDFPIVAYDGTRFIVVSKETGEDLTEIEIVPEDHKHEITLGEERDEL